MKKKPSNLGGARPGSGRKKSPIPTVDFTIKIPVPDAAVIRRLKLHKEVRAAIAAIAKGASG